MLCFAVFWLCVLEWVENEVGKDQTISPALRNEINELLKKLTGMLPTDNIQGDYIYYIAKYYAQQMLDVTPDEIHAIKKTEEYRRDLNTCSMYIAAAKTVETLGDGSENTYNAAYYMADVENEFPNIECFVRQNKLVINELAEYFIKTGVMSSEFLARYRADMIAKAAAKSATKAAVANVYRPPGDSRRSCGLHPKTT